MGSNVSSETQDDTVAAYTYYGFGCKCCNTPIFEAGSPQNDCCGTSCTRRDFVPPNNKQQQAALTELEQALPEAQDIAKEHIRYCSHIICSGVDSTAGQAAAALNKDWCPRINSQYLGRVGLQCSAAREVFGFGRSRVTHLVIRVFKLSESSKEAEA